MFLKYHVLLTPWVVGLILFIFGRWLGDWWLTTPGIIMLLWGVCMLGISVMALNPEGARRSRF